MIDAVEQCCIIDPTLPSRIPEIALFDLGGNFHQLVGWMGEQTHLQNGNQNFSVVRALTEAAN